MSEVDNFLAHFGVIGMKWGIRKLAGTTAGRIGTTAAYSRGQAALAVAPSPVKRVAGALLSDARPAVMLRSKVLDMGFDTAYDRATRAPISPGVQDLTNQYANTPYNQMLPREVNNGSR